MGDFLVVAGFVLACLQDQWTEHEPEVQGDFTRVMDGTGQNSQRSPKRHFSGPVDFLTPAALNQFWAAISVPNEIGIAKKVPVSSSDAGLTRGAVLECYCWIERAQALTWQEGTFWSATLRIKEA